MIRVDPGWVSVSVLATEVADRLRRTVCVVRAMVNVVEKREGVKAEKPGDEQYSRHVLTAFARNPDSHVGRSPLDR